MFDTLLAAFRRRVHPRLHIDLITQLSDGALLPQHQQIRFRREVIIEFRSVRSAAKQLNRHALEGLPWGSTVTYAAHSGGAEQRMDATLIFRLAQGRPLPAGSPWTVANVANALPRATISGTIYQGQFMRDARNFAINALALLAAILATLSAIFTMTHATASVVLGSLSALAAFVAAMVKGDATTITTTSTALAAPNANGALGSNLMLTLPPRAPAHAQVQMPAVQSQAQMQQVQRTQRTIGKPGLF